MTTGPETADSLPDVPSNWQRNCAFVMGIFAGSVVGAGLGMLFAPRAVLEVRRRAADSARSLGTAASDRYREARTRCNEVVDAITKKGQGVRDDLSDAIVRGAQNVERHARDARTGH